MRSLLGVFAATTLALSPALPLSAQSSSQPLFSIAAIEQGIARGDPEAISTLGWAYETGAGIRVNTERAAALYEKAASQGDSFGKWRLGVLIDQGKAPGTAERAVALFREAAAAKSPGAMASLGMMYAEGRGVGRDYEAAMRYYQAAARLGSAHAMEGMGVLYANGQGVPRDIEQALAYWMAAAAAGDGEAMELVVKYMPASNDPAATAIYAEANRIAERYNAGPSDTRQVSASGQAGSE